MILQQNIMLGNFLTETYISDLAKEIYLALQKPVLLTAGFVLQLSEY